MHMSMAMTRQLNSWPSMTTPSSISMGTSPATYFNSTVYGVAVNENTGTRSPFKNSHSPAHCWR